MTAEDVLCIVFPHVFEYTDESNELEVTCKALNEMACQYRRVVSVRGKPDDNYFDMITQKYPMCNKLLMPLRTQLTDGFKYVARWMLRSIELDNCFEVTDEWLQYLQDMPLEVVSLRCCNKITDHGMRYFSGMPIVEFDVHDVLDLTDDGMKYLQDCPIRFLDATHTNVTLASLEYFQTMPLISLHIDEHDDTITELPYGRNLQLKSVTVPIDDNTSEIVTEFLSSMPLVDVQLFNIYEDDEYNGEGLEKISFVHKLQLPSGTQGEVLDKLHDFTNLEELTIDESPYITDDNIFKINHLPLKHLGISNSDITDEGIEHLEGMSLEWLNIDKCKNITDDAIVSLSVMPLRTLIIGNNLSDDCVKIIKSWDLPDFRVRNWKYTGP